MGPAQAPGRPSCSADSCGAPQYLSGSQAPPQLAHPRRTRTRERSAVELALLRAGEHSRRIVDAATAGAALRLEHVVFGLRTSVTLSDQDMGNTQVRGGELDFQTARGIHARCPGHGGP